MKENISHYIHVILNTTGIEKHITVLEVSVFILGKTQYYLQFIGTYRVNTPRMSQQR